jgi:hypothetical protein
MPQFRIAVRRAVVPKKLLPPFMVCMPPKVSRTGREVKIARMHEQKEIR